MTAERPHNAFDRFRRSLQRVVSCFHDQTHVWAFSSDGSAPGLDHVLVPNQGEPVKLQGERDILLSSAIRYRVVQAEREFWKVKTMAYNHTLEDGEGREIIAFHWHPDQGSAFGFPHLHVESGIGADLGGFHKAHVPTGRVSLEAVLRFAVRDFNVEPTSPRWAEVLEETQEEFEASRTWA